jgi:hypothetical protein
MLKAVPEIGEKATRVTESLTAFFVIIILKLFVSASGD